MQRMGLKAKPMPPHVGQQPLAHQMQHIRTKTNDTHAVITPMMNGATEKPVAVDMMIRMLLPEDAESAVVAWTDITAGMKTQ